MESLNMRENKWNSGKVNVPGHFTEKHLADRHLVNITLAYRHLANGILSAQCQVGIPSFWPHVSPMYVSTKCQSSKCFSTKRGGAKVNKPIVRGNWVEIWNIEKNRNFSIIEFSSNRATCFRHLCRKAIVLSCHRCLINTFYNNLIANL